MPDTSKMLKDLGEPIVKAAFQDLLSSNITSKKAKVILRNFSKKWKDYSRAALMVLSCQSVGGDPALVFPAAKALVLTGGAFDLHDDIIDKSYVRTEKRKKTTMGKFGLEASLLSGDAMMIAGLSELFELDTLPKEITHVVIDSIKDGLLELGSAEMDEMSLIRNLATTPTKYLKIVNMKAADVESYMRVGAIIGGGSRDEINGLGNFGRHLGCVVILRDDIKDTFNDNLEFKARIENESLPLPLVYALPDPVCRSMLQRRYESGEEIDYGALLSVIESNDGFEKTKSTIEKHIKWAKASLKPVKYPQSLKSLFI